MLHLVVKRTHACEVTREHSRAVNVIAENYTPITDQVN
jgi:hypothetical protein